jgi:hypothetical protein
MLLLQQLGCIRDPGWLGAGVPDEAVMMRTPNITQEQMPGAAKVRGWYWCNNKLQIDI